MKGLLVLLCATLATASDIFYDPHKHYYVGQVREISDKGVRAVSKSEYFNLTKTGKLEVVHNKQHFNSFAAQTYTWTGAGDWTWDSQYVTGEQTCRSSSCTYAQTTTVTINQSFNTSIDTSTFIPYVNSLNIYALTWVTTASRSNLQLTLSNCQSGALVFQPKGKFIRGTANGVYYMAETPLVATDGQLYGLIWNVYFSTTCSSCNTTAPSGTKQGAAGACCTNDSDCQGTCDNGVCGLCPNCCVDDEDCDNAFCINSVCIAPTPVTVDVPPLVCVLSSSTTTGTSTATVTGGGSGTPAPGGGGGGFPPPPPLSIPCFFCWLGTGLGIGPPGASCQSSNDCSGSCNDYECAGGDPLPSCGSCFAGGGFSNGTNGVICTNNNDCASSLCNNNFCISNVTTTAISTTISGKTTIITKTVPIITTIKTTISGVATTIITANVPSNTLVVATTINTTISGTPTAIMTHVPYIPPTSTTSKTTYSVGSSVILTPSLAPTSSGSSCTSGYCSKGSGSGPTGACCATNNDCVDTCNSNGKCGVSDGTGQPKNPSCGTATSSAPTPTSNPTCTSGYCGKANGGGPTNACCSTSNDCVDTCNSNGQCGINDGTGQPKNPSCGTSSGSSCTSGYCGKTNGGGPTGACCATNNDCVDTCNSNGKCGISDGTGQPNNPSC